ncbi:hypothetical protein HYU92_04565 [Candidatus Curtissbacteria bacterium]|nr:hypothetical protein [Candidatus Curtissbacteria bacterium]
MQTQTYERINILIPKETAKKLRRAIPRGQRSKVVTEAIEERLSQLSHKDMYKELLRIRKKGPKVSLEEVVQWIREDRQSH